MTDLLCPSDSTYMRNPSGPRREAMTDAGNHDTFVAIGATGGVPGGGEIPMELVRYQPLDDFLLASGCRGRIRGIKHLL